MRAKNFVLQSYLERVRYAGPVTADIGGVSSLMRHQLRAVPFENLDMRAGRPVSLAPEDFVAKIVPQRRGGVCYEVNGLFALALDALGVPCELLSARPLSYPDRRPRVHMALLVTLHEERWLCDLGFGSHCLRAPLPLGRVNQEVEQDGERFRLEQGEGRELALRAWMGDRWVSLYGFDLVPLELIDFLPAYHYSATHPDSVFVQKDILMLQTERGKHTLVGDVLKVFDSGVVTQSTVAPGDRAAVLERRFNLAL